MTHFCFKKIHIQMESQPLLEIIVAIKTLHNTKTVTKALYEETRRNLYDIQKNNTTNKTLALWPLFDLLPLIPKVIVNTEQRTMQRISCWITLFVSWVNNANNWFPGISRAGSQSALFDSVFGLMSTCWWAADWWRLSLIQTIWLA